MGSVYVINQIFDIRSDKDNRKLFLIADEYISIKAASIYAAIAGAAGIFGLFGIGTGYGIIALLFFLATGIFYNISPFRWKDNPILGPLVSVFGGAAAFFLGALPEFNGEIILSSSPYLAAFCAVSILTTVPDMEGDASSGKRTIALQMGPGAVSMLALIMCVIAALSGWRLSDRLIFWPALISIPIFAHAALTNGRKSVVLAIKFSIFSLSLAVGFRFPLYILLMGVYFLFARWYYRNRFQMEYPSFKMEYQVYQKK